MNALSSNEKRIQRNNEKQQMRAGIEDGTIFPPLDDISPDVTYSQQEEMINIALDSEEREAKKQASLDAAQADASSFVADQVEQQQHEQHQSTENDGKLAEESIHRAADESRRRAAEVAASRARAEAIRNEQMRQLIDARTVHQHEITDMLSMRERNEYKQRSAADQQQLETRERQEQVVRNESDETRYEAHRLEEAMELARRL